MGKLQYIYKGSMRKREPLDIVRISTALFVRVEQGEWTGILKKEVENFTNVLEKVLKQIPLDDVERRKKLQSFGTGKKLAKRVTTAFEDLCSLTGMKALVIDAESWPEDANTNLQLLKCDIGRTINNTSGYEKTMWERIETELEEVDVESLRFDHPICSEVLDIRSEPFTEMPVSFCDIFKEPFQKYKLEHSSIILDSCKEFIHNEESKINLDEDCMTYKVWKSPKYEAHIKKGKSINEGSYVCEVLAPLINIVMNDLPENPVMWDIWGEEGMELGKAVELEMVYLKTGRPNSSQDKRQRDHKKLIQFSKDSIDTTRKISKLKRVFNLSSKRQILSIFAINIAGDAMELYAMRRESGIYKYCLIEEAPIPLHMTSPSAIYPLIYFLMTLKTAVACTIYKILHNSDSGDSEHSSGEMAITVSTPKNS
ncbi:hypothetical protein C1645_822515 [Glomus cerebriforme]|uniref:Uncharacterized protein n=1 Tax=Glomus cerebriforme TaxID=658196 RepID=A0A397T1B1_9GLOM|nr:hypothetical protein C1645_822515 [Glomus cerebriforme]